MHKWEEGLNALGLEFVGRVGERKVRVRMDGFDFIVYTSSLAIGRRPNILTCTDKTGYFLYKHKDSLTDKLDYSKVKYVSDGAPVTVTCPVHGDIQMTPQVLRQGSGCKACGNRSANIKKTNTHEYNLRRAREVHGDRYEYGFLGVTNTLKVGITCPDHGVFMQNLSSHISSGQGCPECAREANPAFSRSTFAQYPLYYLYVMRLYGDSEDFLKIGISKDPEYRAKDLTRDKDTPYTAEILYTYQTDGVGAWDLESLLHREFREFSYTPVHKFSGSTECFSNVCLDSIKKIAQCCA